MRYIRYTDKNAVGVGEGDVCNRHTVGDPHMCTGTLEYELPENCSCHLSAPCGSCVSVDLHCPKCNWCPDADLYPLHTAN